MGVWICYFKAYACISVCIWIWACLQVIRMVCGNYCCVPSLVCVYVRACVRACVRVSVRVYAAYRVPLCALINKHMDALAMKFPCTKFIRSISTTCIPNYPDHNLPTLFIYFQGDLKGQMAGPIVFGGMKLSQDGEWCWSSCNLVRFSRLGS